jgi:hypothetical protein
MERCRIPVCTFVVGVAVGSAMLFLWEFNRRRRSNQGPRIAFKDGKNRILVVCTGSVAAVKAAELVRALLEEHKLSVDLVLTKSADFFQSVEYKGSNGRVLLENLERTHPANAEAPSLEVMLS